MNFSNMNHWYRYRRDQEIKHCLQALLCSLPVIRPTLIPDF